VGLAVVMTEAEINADIVRRFLAGESMLEISYTSTYNNYYTRGDIEDIVREGTRPDFLRGGDDD